MTTTGCFRLEHDGAVLELAAVREGARTRVTLWMDGEVVAEDVGLGKVLLPVPPVGGAAPLGGGDRIGAEDGADEVEGATVLVLAVLPGVVNRAILLVPRPETAADDEHDPRPAAGRLPVDEIAAALPPGLARLATSARHPFTPPPGSLAARLAELERRHPRLWASRHVVLAVGKVALGLLGLWAFIQLVLRQIVGWLAAFLPEIDLPAIPWPDIDLPDIPWPDLDLPEFTMPGWLLVVVVTAKFWVPVLVAVGVAMMEVRRRRRRTEERADAGGGAER